MPHRDGGSWNAMITAFAHGEAPNEALSLFVSMRKLGVFPSEVTFASVLGSCGDLLELGFSRATHGLIAKHGFSGNVILASSLVDIYGKCDFMVDARKMFDEIGSPNAVSWNVIVRRYLEMGNNREAISMFFQSIRGGFKPLACTFSNALVACSGMLAFKEGTQIHGVAIKVNYEDDEKVATSLIDMYVKCSDVESARKLFYLPNNKDLISWTSMVSGYACLGRTKEARDLFDDMPERSIVSWNAMLAGYVRFGQWEEAMNFILLMCKEINGINHITLNLMLNVSAALSDVEFGKQIHGYIFRHGLHSDIFISNSLLDMYGKCGTLKSARIWFNQMSGWRDRISWNSIMTAFARHRMSEELMTMFSKMLLETTPNEHTFATLFSSCANIFALKQGKEIHGFMVRNGYNIDVVILSAMVDMYSKCRNLDYAIKVFKIAPGDVILWNSMIIGCFHHGKASEALELFELMKEEGVQPDYVTFQGLFNACICGGFVDQGKQYFDAMSSEFSVMARLEHYECMIELYSRHGAMKELNSFIRTLPFDPTVSMLTRVFNACTEYGNPRLGYWAAEQLNKLSVPCHFEMTARSRLGS